MQHTAPYTLHITPAPAIANAPAPVHSYYTLNTGHCTPYTYNICYKIITFH